MAARPFGEHYGSPPDTYERYFAPAIGKPLAVDLVRVAALQAGERVLDVGCLTGTVARRDGAVTGLDVNAGMLKVARAIPTSGASIDWARQAPGRCRCPIGSVRR